MLKTASQKVRFGFLPQLRRDLRMLFGSAPPAISPRRSERRSTSGGLHTRLLRVARIRRETADAVTVFLDDPSGAPLTWQPGQFFTLQLRIDGVIVRRAYSASAPPDGSGQVPLTIKRVPGGVVSNHLNDKLREGERIQVLGPAGSFTLPALGEAGRHVVLIGGGSGITPLAAILKHVLAGEPASRVSLIYGNRSKDDVIFSRDLAELAGAHADRFHLRHVLTVPPEGWDGGVGLLDQPTITAELDRLQAGDADYFVCGPQPMMDAVRAALAARGVPAARVREEKFTSPGQHGSEDLALKEPQRVDVTLGGATHTLTARPGQSLLEAGLAAGLDMPYSCAMGGCAACKVQLVSGPVHADVDGCLTREEREAGFVLACSVRAKGHCQIVVKP